MSCTLRRFHRPRVPGSDHHHIVPQAWQRFWAPRPELLTANGPLWDRRTIEVCPNCHRTIHEWIVVLMRAGTTDDPLEAKLRAFGNRRLSREQGIALEALTRFVEPGGSLTLLRAKRLFGEQ
jgi:hypothetical protein